MEYHGRIDFEIFIISKHSQNSYRNLTHQSDLQRPHENREEVANTLCKRIILNLI